MLDFASDMAVTRRRKGALAYHAGRVAEECVAEHYRKGGAEVALRRWRGQAGEIDLIARRGEQVIFVEVKCSRSHAQAAEHLGARQIARLMAAAEEFLGGEPAGSNTEARFDVALVDGVGRIEVIENALMA